MPGYRETSSIPTDRAALFQLFSSVECVQRWTESSDVEPGYVMDLATLWRLASHWYDGRLEGGYERREPAHALEYFRSVGLSGPFWGLE